MTRTVTDKNIDLSNNLQLKDITSEISLCQRENTVLLINPVCYSNFDTVKPLLSGQHETRGYP